MVRNPKDRTPLVVQAAWDDWPLFEDHLLSERANDNSAWTRDLDGDQVLVRPEPNPEVTRILEGLLEPRQETDMDKDASKNYERNQHEAARLNATMPGRVEFIEQFSKGTPDQRLEMWDKAVEYQVLVSDEDSLASYYKNADRDFRARNADGAGDTRQQKPESYLDRLERQQGEKGQTLADLLPQKDRDKQQEQEKDQGHGLEHDL